MKQAMVLEHHTGIIEIPKKHEKGLNRYKWIYNDKQDLG